MLNLQPIAPPDWMDVPFGVRLLLKPADAVMLTAGRVAARNASEAGADDRESDFAFLAACVQWGLLEWEGVGEGDDPAPINADTVARLLRQNVAIHDHLDREYLLPVLLREAEKNAFAPSPNGTSAGASPIATPPAGGAATSASTTKTPRKRTRGKGSGKSSKGAASS